MNIKKITAFLLSIILVVSLAFSVSAEGFNYEFKVPDPNGNVGPHCESILMMNVDTETIVYSLNPDEPRSIASLTKIMSYIVAYDSIADLHNTLIPVPQSVADELDKTGSSLAGINVGELYTGMQLLNLMMIPSGNDAALTLEKYVDTLNIRASEMYDKGYYDEEDADSERVVDFIELMNMKAKYLGCTNTQFMNSHGLYDPQHYSTARDMMLITKFATTMPDFADITRETMYTYKPMSDENAEERILYSTNRMLQMNYDEYYSLATGIKTGSLNESGYCIAASALYEVKGHSYIIIALGSPYIDENGNSIDLHGEMLDSRELFKWAFTTLEKKTVVTQGDLLGDISLKYAWQQDRLQLVAGESVSAILPESVELSSVIARLDVPENVEAPINKDDTIGQAYLTYADEEIAVVPLVASESVERSEIVMTLDQGKEVFTSTWFLVIVSGIGLLIVIYIILIIVYRNKRKRYKNVRRHRNL